MESTNISHQNNFHLLRHIAAFFVIYAHCTPFGKPEFFNLITNGRIEMGSLGVEIFFIVSGYLVTQSLLNTHSRWQFVKKRFLRLWPALSVVTFIIAVLVGPLLSTLSLVEYFKNPLTWRFFFRNICFIPVYQLPGLPNGYAGNANFWTLFFEVNCYFFLLLLGQKILIKYKWAIATAWLLAFILKYLLPNSLQWPSFLEQYSAGISNMMFLFFTAGIWRLYAKSFAGRKLWIGALALFIICGILPFEIHFLKPLRDLSLVIAVIEFGKNKPVFNWPTWDISYGTYLIGGVVEMLLLQYTKQIGGSHLLLLCTTLGITLPLAFASWYFLERPALRKKAN